jgi:hypothetical protein
MEPRAVWLGRRLNRVFSSVGQLCYHARVAYRANLRSWPVTYIPGQLTYFKLIFQRAAIVIRLTVSMKLADDETRRELIKWWLQYSASEARTRASYDKIYHYITGYQDRRCCSVQPTGFNAFEAVCLADRRRISSASLQQEVLNLLQDQFHRNHRSPQVRLILHNSDF